MKKKMKKIFSKLTVMVLLVSMLIPYTNIPTVEAADDWDCSEENTEYHTNYYFFAELSNPREWIKKLATNGSGSPDYDDKYSATYYTSFLYNFPSNGTKMEITSADFVTLKDTGTTSEFISTTSWSLKAFYSEFLKMYDGDKTYDYADAGNYYKQYSYLAQKGGTKNNPTVTYLTHGPWGFVGIDKAGEINSDIEMKDTESVISKESYIEANNINYDVSDNTVINALANATIIPKSVDIQNLNIGLSSALSSNSKTSIINTILSFNKNNGELATEGIYQATTMGSDNKPTTTGSGDTVLKLFIKRTYLTEDILEADMVSGVRQKTTSDGGTYYFSSTVEAGETIEETNKLYFPNIGCVSTSGTDVTDCNSNDKAYITINDGTKSVSKATAVKLVGGTNHDTTTYWFISPALFQISYKVCKASNTSADDVTLSYNGNESSVSSTNKADKVPSSQTQAKGSDFIVSATEPTLSGYTFKNWNTQADCKGTNVEPEAK